MMVSTLCLVLVPVVVQAKEDYYFRACNKLIMKHKAYAGIGALDPKPMYETLHMSEEYHDSLADCIVTCSALTNSSESQQEKVQKVSWGYFGYMCNYYHIEKVEDWSIVAARISRNPVTMETDNSTLRVKVPESKLLLDNIIPAGEAFYRARSYPNSMGWGLIYYLVGIFGIQIIINLVGRLLPRIPPLLLRLPVISELRRYFSLPPLMGPTASRVLQNYNQRLHYLWIFGFIILNILFACLGYDGQVTSSLYYPDKTHMYSSAIAFRTGYLAMYMLPVVFLTGTRNNLLILFTGWNLDVFNLWHRWLGRLCFLQGVAHAAAYHVHYHKSNTVGAEWKEAFWRWGFVVLLLWGLMCVQGTKPLRALAYDLFVLSHIAFAVMAMVGLHVHLWYTIQCKIAWYACIAFWGADHLVRLLRIVANGVVIDAKVSTHTSEAVALDFHCSNLTICPPGSFLFVHFAHPLMFWQSHPFTVVPMSNNEYRRLIIKPRDGLTEWVYKKSFHKQSLKIFIDGPYFNLVNFKPFDTISFIAGGVGVTAVYAHLLSLSSEKISSSAISFDWIIRSEDSMEYFKDELDVLKNMPVELTIHVTTQTSNVETEEIEFGAGEKKESKQDKGVVTFKSHTKSEQEPSLLQKIMLPAIPKCQKSLAYFVCGPPSLNREARELVASQVPITSKYLQLYDESFAM